MAGLYLSAEMTGTLLNCRRISHVTEKVMKQVRKTRNTRKEKEAYLQSNFQIVRRYLLLEEYGKYIFIFLLMPMPFFAATSLNSSSNFLKKDSIMVLAAPSSVSFPSAFSKDEAMIFTILSSQLPFLFQSNCRLLTFVGCRIFSTVTGQSEPPMKQISSPPLNFKISRMI